MYFRRRSGIGRTVTAVIVIVIVVVVAAAAVLYKSPSTTSTSSPSPTTSMTVSPSVSTSTTSSAVGLDITAMYLEVQGSFQAPSVNVTTIGNNLTSFTGTTSDQFTVTVDIAYTNCRASSCPSEVSQVVACPSTPQPGQTVSCPGASTTSNVFTVEEVDGGAGPPVPANTLSSTSENFIFGVSMQGPSSPYDGNFTLICAMS